MNLKVPTIMPLNPDHNLAVICVLRQKQHSISISLEWPDDRVMRRNDFPVKICTDVHFCNFERFNYKCRDAMATSIKTHHLLD